MRLIYVLLTGLVLYSCGPDEPLTRTPEQIKEDLRKAELHSPSMYLSVEGAVTGNTVHFTVTNTAKEAEFRLVKVAVNYFDDSRKLMGSEIIQLEKTLQNASAITHTQEVSPPPGYQSVSFAIREAK